MADRNFKPDSGEDLVLEDAGSTDRLRITDGGSTILYEDGGAAALTIDTDGNTVIADGNRIQTDEVRAYDSAGLKLYDDGGTGIFIKDGGRHVAIGHNAPVNDFGADRATLTLKGGSGDNYSVIEMYNDQTSPGNNFGFIAFGDYTEDSENCRIAGQRDSGGADSGKLLFYTRASGESLEEKMTIDDSGNVGIPTVNASHKLQVTGSAGLSTGTAWTNTSDERIKTNIKTIENALDKINQLRPVSYNYSNDYLEQHPELNPEISYNSFLAQEYAVVFPDAVSVGENLEKITVEAVEAKEAVLDTDGNEISPAVEAVEEVREIIIEDMLQFTPHDLNMYLVGAVQELSAKVEALENA
jgi:hypothetical protein